MIFLIKNKKFGPLNFFKRQSTYACKEDLTHRNLLLDKLLKLKANLKNSLGSVIQEDNLSSVEGETYIVKTHECGTKTIDEALYDHPMYRDAVINSTSKLDRKVRILTELINTTQVRYQKEASTAVIIESPLTSKEGESYITRTLANGLTILEKI